MGGKLGAGGGPMADINVTPLIDVVLVLLVVFMVITPMLSSGLAVDLPVATATVETKDLGQYLVISVTTDGRWGVDEDVMDEPDEAGLIRMVQEAFNRNPERSILIKADSRLPYEDVRVVMDALAAERFTAVKLAVDKEG